MRAKTKIYLDGWGDQLAKECGKTEQEITDIIEREIYNREINLNFREGPTALIAAIDPQTPVAELLEILHAIGLERITFEHLDIFLSASLVEVDILPQDWRLLETAHKIHFSDWEFLTPLIEQAIAPDVRESLENEQKRYNHLDEARHGDL